MALLYLLNPCGKDRRREASAGMQSSLLRTCRILALLLVAAAVAGCGTQTMSLTNGIAATQPAASVPKFSHIFVIVLENRAYDQVIGNQQESYLNSLAHEYSLAEQYYGVSHPSLPNYLALIGGDTFGISSDCTDCFVNQTNLVDQIEASGRNWTAYQESMPHACFMGDAPPSYRQKHNPFIYFDNIRNNPARCAKIVPFTQFASDVSANTVPDFAWITPNMCNDGHDCPASTTDAWLRTVVPQITGSPAWRDNGVLFITFDESEKADENGCCQYAQGGRLATLVISPLGKPGFRSSIGYDHYSLLRTIEASWGLEPLNKAACACTPTMADFFQ